MSEAGFNFYAHGYCWKLANLIHFDLTRLCPPESYDALLHGYQAFSRQPSRESLVAFQETLGSLNTGGSETVETIFGNVRAGTNRFERYHTFHEFAGSDELHVSTLMASIGWWRRHFEDDFEIVHDASANFFRRKGLWDRIGNDGQPAEIQVAGDGTEVEFPLKVIATNQVDSKNSPSVQLCDLIAGLVAREMNPNLGQDDRLFLDQLIEHGLGRLDWNGVRPQEVFPDRDLPIRRDGPDVIDQLARRIYGHLPNPN